MLLFQVLKRFGELFVRMFMMFASTPAETNIKTTFLQTLQVYLIL